MFPRRKALNLIILSILNDNDEGLTGYSIVKQMKTKFGPNRVPSPGTIYPRLEKLKHRGLIVEEGNTFKISSKGKEKLTQNIPEILDGSFEFMPMFYRTLMRPLPFRKRVHYLPDMACFSSHRGFTHQPDVFDSSFPDISDSIPRLKDMKERLIEVKKEIEKRMKAELVAIDEKINRIDERIKEEKASRVKIPVEDGDAGNE